MLRRDREGEIKGRGVNVGLVKHDWKTVKEI
jgi:hypothetical protein